MIDSGFSDRIELTDCTYHHDLMSLTFNHLLLPDKYDLLGTNVLFSSFSKAQLYQVFLVVHSWSIHNGVYLVYLNTGFKL